MLAVWVQCEYGASLRRVYGDIQRKTRRQPEHFFGTALIRNESYKMSHERTCLS